MRRKHSLLPQVKISSIDHVHLPRWSHGKQQQQWRRSSCMTIFISQRGISYSFVLYRCEAAYPPLITSGVRTRNSFFERSSSMRLIVCHLPTHSLRQSLIYRLVGCYRFLFCYIIQQWRICFSFSHISLKVFEVMSCFPFNNMDFVILQSFLHFF